MRIAEKINNIPQAVRDEVKNKFEDFDYNEFIFSTCLSKRLVYPSASDLSHLVNALQTLVNAYAFGHIPGSFSGNILQNDFVSAVSNSDHINSRYLCVHAVFMNLYLKPL